MRRRGAFLFPILVLLIGVSIFREAAVGWLVSAEEAWESQLARHLTYLGTPPPVTLVEINDETLADHTWPWTSEDFAVFLNNALPETPGGQPWEPSVIGIEPILDFENGALAGGERNALHDRALHDGILRAPKLALGGRFGWSREIDSVQPLMPVPVLNRIRGETNRLPTFTGIDAWAEESLRLSTAPGWTNIPVEPAARGLYALVLRYRGQPVPSMALQLAMMWARVTVDDVEVVLGEYIALGDKIRIPIDDQARMQVNFGAEPARINYDNLQIVHHQLEENKPPLFPASTIHKKVLVLARTDAAARTLVIPAGIKVSPGELAAYALATIQASAHPSRIGCWFDWTLIALTAFASFWLPRWRTARMASIVILSEIAYISAALLLFRQTSIALPGVLPLGLVLWLLTLRVFAKPILRVIAF